MPVHRLFSLRLEIENRSAAALSQTAEQNANDTQNNCCIGQVERGPVERAEVKVQKVSHGAVVKPVNEIACGATCDRCDSHGFSVMPDPSKPDQKNRDHYSSCDR